MKVIRRAVGLWLTPDFSLVDRGERPVPYVNHDTLDYTAITEFMEEHFYCGERVKLRFPNDTVDLVTVQQRARGASAGPFDCHDFAERLLEATPGSRVPIGVRNRWSALHVLSDRTHAPPPALLLFVVEGRFEPVMFWFNQAQYHLNIRAADLARVVMGELEEGDRVGRLDPPLATHLEHTFGIPYKPNCLLNLMARGESPEDARPSERQALPHRKSPSRRSRAK